MRQAQRVIQRDFNNLNPYQITTRSEILPDRYPVAKNPKNKPTR